MPVPAVLVEPAITTIPLGAIDAFCCVCDGVAGPLGNNAIRGSATATLAAGLGVTAAASNLVHQALQEWPAFAAKDGAEGDPADNASAAVAVLH